MNADRFTGGLIADMLVEKETVDAEMLLVLVGILLALAATVRLGLRPQRGAP